MWRGLPAATWRGPLANWCAEAHPTAVLAFPQDDGDIAQHRGALDRRALGALDAPNVALGALDAPNVAFGASHAPNATLGRSSPDRPEPPPDRMHAQETGRSRRPRRERPVTPFDRAAAGVARSCGSVPAPAGTDPFHQPAARVTTALPEPVRARTFSFTPPEGTLSAMSSSLDTLPPLEV